jgi:2-hydroxychromene-2-carboxylate isomerase
LWVQGKNMADDAVIAATLLGAGLDARALMAAAQDAAVKGHALANTQVASDRGASGSRTFIVGDPMYFGKDRLREVEEAIAQVATR